MIKIFLKIGIQKNICKIYKRLVNFCIFKEFLEFNKNIVIYNYMIEKFIKEEICVVNKCG